VELVRLIADTAYDRYHRRAFLHPDPLEIVHDYSTSEDREVVAFISSSLALGQVHSILAACRQVLAAFPHPRRDLARLSRAEIAERLPGFVYRFFRTSHMSDLLFGLGEMLRRYGTLEDAFLQDYTEDDDTVLPALSSFARRLSAYAGGDHGILISFPDKGSASKRLHLFLRWMVRSDELDLGVWRRVDPARLLVPVDTHMLRIARYLGLTSRKTADRRAAEEVTAAFRRINPADPAKYDFALTRAGIHPDLAARSLTETLGCAPPT
jgi:uncharacterized protein (TIGR02757 family)